MTKRQGRLFFIVCTVLFSVVFIALTIDSHRQFGKLTNADKITPEVIAGKHVWHKNNCINCHTLMGEGAYYAPDLTKITAHRGCPVSQGVPQGPVAVLFRGEAPAPDAQPAPHRPRDR